MQKDLSPRRARATVNFFRLVAGQGRERCRGARLRAAAVDLVAAVKPTGRFFSWRRRADRCARDRLFLAAFPFVGGTDGGGPHIVEDSEVLQPGLCQAIRGSTRFHRGAGHATRATWTPTSLRRLEWGLQVQHYSFNSRGRRPASGAEPEGKYRAEDKASSWPLLQFRVTCAPATSEPATLLLPVTIRRTTNPPEPEHRLADFCDWPHARWFSPPVGRSRRRWAGTLMFLNVRTPPSCCGSRGGVRWRPNDGPIDFDFFVGGSSDRRWRRTPRQGEFLLHRRVTLRW